MKTWKKALISAWLLLAASAIAAEPVTVLMTTSKGDITLELDADKAPGTVNNFLAYVDEGFYSGTIFHRVIKDFMLQGGGFTADMDRKDTRGPIPNEADNGLKNLRGTVAMARTNKPDSATAQFFINHKDNAFLDHRSKDARGWGYAVFGRVVDGMDVVDAIASEKTGVRNRMQDVPLETVTIDSVSRVEPAR